LTVHDEVSVALETEEGAKIVRLKPKSESRMAKKIWPTMRVLIKNMIIGVSEGYKKNLEIKGVGLRANLQGQTLVMTLGFSHEIRFAVPKGIQVKVQDQTALEITGIDKQQVGQVAANIRGFKPPEPYKGKCIRYVGERVLQKEGKKK
ncbi:MAG: 50S ribosomal protein L6, partial [Alphaproteobacteria bacterium]|nr:50S ribosomal protein L6 [Alphaproteobacteria bacterium]